ncbi:MAG: restriction endonuclease subunit S [Weeksellaceae bacterium]|nr:restriction endonuclease subunit S [Weeksellaceae bacterium]
MRFPEFEDEWEKKKFSKYIKLFRGSSPRPIVKFITKDENGVNWIKIGDTKNTDNSIINNVEEKITIEGARKSRKVTNGELILANSMSFGKTYQLSIDGYIYDGWFVLREYENYFEKSFLLQLLNSDYLQKQYKRLSAGGVVQNISSEIVYETILIRPSLQEQKKISSFLSLIDENITTQKKIILNYESLIQSFRDDLLKQKIRFKDESGNNYPDWEKIKLEEVCEKQSSNISANKIEDNFGEFPIYGATGFLKNIDFYEVETDYIAIIKDGAGVGRLFLCSGKSSVLGTLDIITPKNINLYFLYCLLSNINFDKYSTGSTIPHIYFKDYKKEFCMTPCIEEQTKIADFLSKISDKIETEKKILELLEQQKKYFLQNMFI